ncbi:acetylcholine receptor subunit alpha-like [Tetranychus urticae]|uniref:Uncharacterized protein n=1 Tax=Tetranychus urticae TaxID=32264 RepID=T1KCW5_TETUR|nr:acetylcholine receptor subunit alpha-like [Tetranychus urticae]
MNSINFSKGSFLGLIFITLFELVSPNPDAKRLYDDLMNGYNKMVTPRKKVNETVVVRLGLKLTQILELNLKQQVFSANMWIPQKWYDYNLSWDPEAYGGVNLMNVPAENIWQPDLILFNNADGNFEPTLITKALVHYTGEVVWEPPALYKVTCQIDVEWFPFDVQSCLMKFGSWTYDGHEVDLRHLDQVEGSVQVDRGVDLSEFYQSVEWDLMKVPARYENEYYDCCPEPFPHITFNITMRRKTLFYTVNLIIPVVGISFLTLLVFYLPSDSGEKVTLSISILVSLTVFFLLLAEIIPPTSLAVPLLGKYLLFTMLLITLSICFTVCVLNVHFRSPSTHVMSPWVKHVFIEFLPKILCIKRPTTHDLAKELATVSGTSRIIYTCEGDRGNITERVAPDNQWYESYDCLGDIAGLPVNTDILDAPMEGRIFGPSLFNSSNNQINWSCKGQPDQLCPNSSPSLFSEELQRAIESILHIANHLKEEDREKNVIEDWKYVAMVLDRLFLWIFTLSCIIGTCVIILRAPSLYDNEIPIDHLAQQMQKLV